MHRAEYRMAEWWRERASAIRSGSHARAAKENGAMTTGHRPASCAVVSGRSPFQGRLSRRFSDASGSTSRREYVPFSKTGIMK